MPCPDREEPLEVIGQALGGRYADAITVMHELEDAGLEIVSKPREEKLRESLNDIAETACGTCQPEVDVLGSGGCAGCYARAALSALDREGRQGTDDGATTVTFTEIERKALRLGVIFDAPNPMPPELKSAMDKLAVSKGETDE